MKKTLKRLAVLGLTAAMVLSAAGCGSGTSGSSEAVHNAEADGSGAGSQNKTGEPVTLKITWWGGQSRHDYTQKLLDTYTPVSYTHL